MAFFPKIYKAAGYPTILSHMQQQGAQEYADPINWLLYQVRWGVGGAGCDTLPWLWLQALHCTWA